MTELLVVVRVRGSINLSQDMKRTFEQLNLNNKNWCIISKKEPSAVGMINKVKDYVTWGEISDEVLKQLVEKRGDLYKSRVEDSKSKINYNKYVELNGKKYKKVFRLSPPKKGYGRKGIKHPFSQGGALGYRADKIKDLLERMM